MPQNVCRPKSAKSVSLDFGRRFVVFVCGICFAVYFLDVQCLAYLEYAAHLLLCAVVYADLCVLSSVQINFSIMIFDR